MNTTKPLISIIVVSYNTQKITINCLESIIKDKGLDFTKTKNSKTEIKIPAELIVVDNNSPDNSVRQIRQFALKHHLSKNNFHFIVNQSNLGYGQANNQAINIAKGGYILLLNSDTVILHSAISQSLFWLSNHPEAVICTAQLLNPDRTIQPSGGYFPTILNILSWSLCLDDLPILNRFILPFHPHPPNFFLQSSLYTKDHPQDWVTGAFLLSRAEALHSVNGFSSDFFMYGEELEMTFRIKKLFPSLQVWYLIGPQIIHYGQASSPTKTAPIYNEYLGIVRFFQKHRPSWQRPCIKILLKVNCLTRVVLYYILNQKNTSLIYQQIWSKI